jgi:TrfB plasmid transcriptional repressor
MKAPTDLKERAVWMWRAVIVEGKQLSEVARVAGLSTTRVRQIVMRVALDKGIAFEERRRGIRALRNWEAIRT